MAKTKILVLLIISLLPLAYADYYKYASWSDLPHCAQNCLSKLVLGSINGACSGTNITCACYDWATPNSQQFFDTAYNACITKDHWISSNNTGGCYGHPDNQDVDIKELIKYEKGPFCYLNNATCSHDGSCNFGQSSSSSSTSSSQSTSTSSSSTSTTTTTSNQTPSLSSSSTSISPPTSTMSTPFMSYTTVGVVVTASPTHNDTSTSPASAAATTTTASGTGQASSSLSNKAQFKSTLALLMLVAGMMFLLG